MYEYFKGILSKITAKYIVVEVGQIGYILHVANPYAYSGQVNQEIQVFVHQVVREDAQLLYGFRTEDEKQLFLNLISVSGIGPVATTLPSKSNTICWAVFLPILGNFVR